MRITETTLDQRTGIESDLDYEVSDATSFMGTLAMLMDTAKYRAEGRGNFRRFLTTKITITDFLS